MPSPPAAAQTEGDGGVGDRDDSTRSRILALSVEATPEKLPACRRVLKSASTADRRAPRMGEPARPVDSCPPEPRPAFLPRTRRSMSSGVSRETDAIDGRASPRKPNVVIDLRSSAPWILACGVPFEGQDGVVALHSAPVICHLQQSAPPSAISMRIRDAPASSAFSTSSLTTDSGRSTTSPAAI